MADCARVAVPEAFLEEIDSITDTDALKGRLGDLFPWADDAQVPVLEELFYYSVAFARECDMSHSKTGALLGIVEDVVRHDSEKWSTTLEGSFSHFRQLLVKHAVERPPHSSEIFCEKDVPRIIDYMLDNYYRHFSMYKFALASRPDLDLRVFARAMVEPPQPAPPLRLAVRLPEDDD